jgi:hypothetical protein
LKRRSGGDARQYSIRRKKKRTRRIRRNFSIREKAAKLREKMTWHNIISFVSVAGLRSFVGQQASSLATSAVKSDVIAQVEAAGSSAVATVTKSFAGMSGFQALSGLGRDEE